MSDKGELDSIYNNIYQNYNNEGIDWQCQEHFASVIQNCVEWETNPEQRENALELGPGKGLNLDILTDLFENVDFIEGSETSYEKNKKLYKIRNAHHALFEDFDKFGTADYNLIVAGHVLEHVDDIDSFLNKVYASLKPKGYALFSVPNASSLHRQIGVQMGVLETPYSLSETDIKVGHKRVFDLKSLRYVLSKKGLATVDSDGYLLKTMSNAQIDKVCDWEACRAMVKAGVGKQDIAADIWVLVQK